MTGRNYNSAAGMAVVCPLTSLIKPYPSALRVSVKGREGCVLTDHIKSMNWRARRAEFYDRAPEAVSDQTRELLSVFVRHELSAFSAVNARTDRPASFLDAERRN